MSGTLNGEGVGGGGGSVIHTEILELWNESFVKKVGEISVSDVWMIKTEARRHGVYELILNKKEVLLWASSYLG